MTLIPSERTMPSERAVLLKKIQETQAAIQTAGPVHRRDLVRHIQKLNRALRLYDRTH